MLYRVNNALSSRTALHIEPAPPTTSYMDSDISDTEVNDLYEDISQHNGYVPKFPPPSTPIVPTTAATLSPHKDMPPNDHKRCRGVTRAGLPCRLNPNSSSPYCYKHVK